MRTYEELAQRFECIAARLREIKPTAKVIDKCELRRDAGVIERELEQIAEGLPTYR